MAYATLEALQTELCKRIDDGTRKMVINLAPVSFVDSFGLVGEDPGSFWACPDGNTANHTMRRLSGICAGDVDTGDVFNPCDQWTFAPSDVFSGLGDHIADCGAVANEPLGWGQLKASFR